ncbi:MAG: hypothetical protein FGM14_01305 [Flavobacteriales bacterium]|nr:hypothetical protein [Flavobacteriales bacterium]
MILSSDFTPWFLLKYKRFDFIKFLLVFGFYTFFFHSSAQVVDITRWDFETGSPLAGGNSTPSPTSGIGSAQKVGSMSGETVATGTINSCTGSNSTGTQAWQIGTANPGTLESSGVEFKASTVGYENIQFTWDQRSSNASTRTVRVQYTTDGTTWQNLTLTSSNFISGCANRSAIDNGKIDVGSPITTNAGDAWSRRTVDFSSLTAANDNPNFGVRLLASHYDATNQFKQAQNFSNNVSTSTPGTWRFDNVAFRGTALLVSSYNPFQSCNLLVYRVGDGSSSLSSSAAQVSIIELDTLGTIVQTVSNFTGANILTQSGSATSNGYFNTFNNLTALPGHNEAIGTVSVNSNDSKRVLITDNSLNYSLFDLPTSAPVPFNNDNFRSVIPTSATTFYASGNSTGTGSPNGGIWYFNGSSYVQLLSGNIRNIEIFNDTLYYSTGSGTIGVYKFLNGLPIAGSNQPTAAIATYVTTSGTGGPYGFSISPDGCTLYIADAGSSGSGSYPGISKWTRSGGNYTFQYSFSTNAIGIVVDYSGVYPILYATTTQNSNNQIIKIKDIGVSSASSILLSAGSNYVFRGIDFTPSSIATITINTQPQAVSVCQNAATQLSVSAVSSASLTYQWFSNTVNSYCGATPISGAQSSTYSPPVSSTGTIYYFVKIYTGCQSIVFSNRVAITVNEPIIPTFTTISPKCPGENFSLPTTSTNAYFGSWSPSINTSHTTNYTFTPSSGQCATTTSMTVQVTNPPRILAISPP